MEEKQENQEKPEKQETGLLEKAGKLFSDKKLKKENFIVVLLIGILLLVIAWPVSDKKSQEQTSKSGITDSNADILDLTAGKKEQDSQEKDTGTDTVSLQGYTKQMEHTLEEILSTMEGAGKVKVMITLKASEETVIEKDTVRQRSGTTEVDSEGGSRNTSDISDSEETVYTSTQGGTDAPFVKQIISPQIEGVVVSAQGGNNKTVIKNITEAIQALFGVEVHKIKVIKMISN